MNINNLDKKIDELFVKLDENIKELDKENLKKHLKNLQNAENEYNKQSKLLDLEIKSYKEKIIQFKLESTQSLEKIMNEATKKIDYYVEAENSLVKKNIITNNLEGNLIELKETVKNIISRIEICENRRSIDNNEIGIFINKNNEQIEGLKKANECSQKQMQEVNKYIKELKNEIDFLKKEVRDKNKIIEETILDNKQGLGGIIKKIFKK